MINLGPFQQYFLYKEKKIADLEELNKSILQLALSPVEGKAFTGELATSASMLP
jgi:hypothetical protein